MSTTLLIATPWLAIGLGVIAVAVDHLTALYEAYLYHTVMKGSIDYVERYRLTPEVQTALTQRRWFGPRLLVICVVLALAIGAAWWVCVQQLARPDVFVLLMGGLVLAPTADTLRQYQQIMVFREVRRRGGLQGRVTVARQLSFMQTVYSLYSYVIVYLVLFVFTGSWFVLGGALATFVNSRRLRDWVVIKT